MTLASALQTVENREIHEKWLEMIWKDIGRHLQDIELKFMSLTIDILVDVISTGKPYPSSFMLDRAIPILVQVYNTQENPSKQCLILHYISRLLKDSAEPGKVRPGWYDNLLNIAISGLENGGAQVLSNGSHFLEKSNAEQIFDTIFKASEHYELMEKCIKMSKGSRPTDANVQELFDLEKGPALGVVFQVRMQCIFFTFFKQVFDREVRNGHRQTFSERRSQIMSAT